MQSRNQRSEVASIQEPDVRLWSVNSSLQASVLEAHSPTLSCT